jgi:hypothetical protein
MLARARENLKQEMFDRDGFRPLGECFVSVIG